MSERGSFCTEYIYCRDCFNAVKKVLMGNEKYLKTIIIPSWSSGESYFPIIAGKLGGSYAGSEFVEMEYNYIPRIQELMKDDCKIRICVHSDSNGSIIYEFNKDEILKEVKLDN